MQAKIFINGNKCINLASVTFYFHFFIMTRFLYISFILLLFSCSEKPQQEEKKLAETKASRFDLIQGLFLNKTIDTFYVYSTWELEDKNYAFKGEPLDSLQVDALPYDIKFGYSFNKDYGACYKFPLNNKQMAMIIRAHGEYVSSSVRLMVFDIEKDSVTKTLYLSDVFGDAGESMVSRSCIFKNSKGEFLILTYRQNSYDHNVNGDANDTIVENWNQYTLINLSKNGGDTLAKDSASVVKGYSSIVKRLTDK